MPVEGDGGEFAMARTEMELVLAKGLGLDGLRCCPVISVELPR